MDLRNRVHLQQTVCAAFIRGRELKLLKPTKCNKNGSQLFGSHLLILAIVLNEELSCDVCALVCAVGKFNANTHMGHVCS